jgi:hypothetical protein
VAQFATGLVWAIRAAALRSFVKRRPGTFVALTTAPALAAAALGGSGPDSLWVTSTECWLVGAGAMLTLRGVISLTAAGTVVVGAAWVAADGTTGGYGADGNYLVAIIALAKVLAVGLWLGQVLAATWTLLERWNVIERGERGVVERLRSQLVRVDVCAAVVGARLAAVPQAVGELQALRARLERGVGLREADGPIPLLELLTEIVDEHADSGSKLRVQVEPSAEAAALSLPPSEGASLVAVLRRQLLNVERHAPGATCVTIRAAHCDSQLTVTLEDDGGASTPLTPGTGTAWSARQLGRFGGTVTYYDAPKGIGVSLKLPTRSPGELSAVPDLSVARSLDHLASGMMAALRWAAYIGDTLVASAEDGIGARWLLMPAGALVIEYALQRGVPGMRLHIAGRRIAAAVLAVLLTLLFTIPADSPGVLVPASTSVVVLAPLLLNRQTVAWLALEFGRALAVIPLVVRDGASVIELVVVYPVAFNLVTYALRRFVDRARGLERRTLDAFGRAALSSATVHGLALRHDVVDVLLRTGPDDPQLAADAADLEDAVRDLSEIAAEVLDPRAVVTAGVEAALAVPVRVEDGSLRASPTTSVAGAIDRVTLSEIAALAAVERASCAPFGLLGRRRLRSMRLHWNDAATGGVELRLAAEPSLRPPDPDKLDALETVAHALGVAVESSAEELRLVYQPR